MASARGILTKELPIFAFKVAVAVGEAQLPITLRSVTAGDEDVRFAVAPLYTSFEEMYLGLERTADLVLAGRHRDVAAIEGGVT